MTPYGVYLADLLMYSLLRARQAPRGAFLNDYPPADEPPELDLGKAVQVEPMQPMLKTPGTERLKLEYNEPPSNFAFKFYLRRYTLGGTRWRCGATGGTAGGRTPANSSGRPRLGLRGGAS